MRGPGGLKTAENKTERNDAANLLFESVGKELNGLRAARRIRGLQPELSARANVLCFVFFSARHSDRPANRYTRLCTTSRRRLLARILDRPLIAGAGPPTAVGCPLLLVIASWSTAVVH